MLAILSHLSRHIYTHNVDILLNRADLQESHNNKKFHQNRSRGLPVLHCLREVMHYWFLILCFFCHALELRSLW